MKQFVFESLNEFLSAQKEKFLKNAFPAISDEDFKKLSEADPSEKGIYTQWLLSLYSKDQLKLEDLYKATEYLELFDTPKVKNRLEIKDINGYKGLPDLYKAIEPFKEKVSSGQLQSKSGILDQTFVKEFRAFNLYIPKTYEQSCQLGSGTEWCTATGKTRSHWDRYSKQGDLFVFIFKKKPSLKVQLHIQSRQLMDKDDEPIDKEKFFKTNPDIKDWLNTEKDEAADLVLGKHDINLNLEGLIKLPEGLPKKCKGYFNCNDNKLLSLKGASEWVGGDFYCNTNNLTTLKGAPKYVGGEFNCSFNNLRTLEGAPEWVGGYFSCSMNTLLSLEGAPEWVGGDFDCTYNNLTTLEGAPKHVGGDFYCSSNKLSSLEGAPKHVGGHFDCRYNELLTLEGAPKYVGGNFYYTENKNITKEEIEKYRKTGAVKGKILY